MSSSISLSLRNTFGGIPPMVYEHMKYFTYDENREDFSCILCDKVVHKNSPKTFEAHLKSVSHREKSCPADEVTRALTITFPGKIPQVVKNNVDVLDVVEEGYKCVICDKIIKVSTDPKISVDNFSYHLTSSGHKIKLESYDEQLEQLNDVYGYIPQVVDNNKEFLQMTRSGKNYVCTLCDELLKVDRNNMEQTENLFDQHFHEHHWDAKKSKVLSLIPELQYSKSGVHTYLMRNIDYISNNGADLFCSLCHENIKRNSHDVNETVENLKHHILSSEHEENGFSRQNEDNIKLNNLGKVIGAFTDEILKNLRYLELSDSSFSCSICNEEFYTEPGYDELNDDIFLHLESAFHQSNVAEEESRQKDVIESLENIFGKIPHTVEENLAYIEFVHGNSFQCTLCQVTLQSKNLERHLRSNRHTEAKEDDENVSESLHEDLEDLLGHDYKDKIPECIYSNWSHIEYERDSGNFCCTLCDETILVDEGNKKEEITLQNFERHLYSAGHTIKLKEKAKNQMKTYEKLESIYGGISKCILSNVQVLYEKDEDSFSCDKCDVELRLGSSARTTAQNFIQHLRGSLHISNIEDIETSIDDAFQFLNDRFGVPEGLLRDVDFWDNSDDPDLYCTLCQQELSVDLDDLKQTRWSLECHVDSERHKSNLYDL